MKQESGFTLIGLLILALIIASLTYGGSFFLNKNRKNAKSLQQSVNNQLNKIQTNVDKANELKTNAINGTENVINDIQNTDSQINKIKSGVVNKLDEIKRSASSTE
jgi:type II secretory pathway pseudopilin PulG